MEIEPNTASGAVNLTDLERERVALVEKLHFARQLEAEATTLRLCEGDPAQRDLELAECLADIRAGINAICDQLEAEGGEHWTPGLRATHFAREVRNASQALKTSEIQLDRLNFVSTQIAKQLANPIPVKSSSPSGSDAVGHAK